MEGQWSTVFCSDGCRHGCDQALGRWGSNAVEGYIADAATSATLSLAPALGSRIRSAVESGLTASASRVQEDFIQQLTSMANKGKEVEMVVKVVRAAMERLSGPALVKYVMNIGHKVAFRGEGVPVESWRTQCGWRFGIGGRCVMVTDAANVQKWCRH
eukprot:6279998-Amphidinium_carterae.1